MPKRTSSHVAPTMSTTWRPTTHLWCAVCLAILFSVPIAAGGEFPAPPAKPGAQQPTALIELDGTASENPEGGEMRYEWRQIEGPKVELSDATAAKPYFRTGKPGLYRFELVVTSKGLKSEPFVVEIMIERDNEPPVAVIKKVIDGKKDELVAIDGSGSFDPEGEEITYRWRFVRPGMDPGLPESELGKPVLSFTPDKYGEYEVELVVSDGKAVSRPITTVLKVLRPPQAVAKAKVLEVPTIPGAGAGTAALPPLGTSAMAPPAPGMPPPPETGAKLSANIEGPTMATLGERIMLDARGSRSNAGRRTEYLWRQRSGPFIRDFELLFDGAAERFQPSEAGIYEFELVVSDGSAESAPAVHRLQVVKDADPPVAVVVAPSKAVPGALVKLDASQSYDLEGNKLIYRWRQTGGPKVTRYLIDERLGDSAPAFHPASAGIYSFELIVANSRKQSKPVSIDIEVGDVRRPPTLSVAGPPAAKTGDRVVLSATAGDAGDRRFAWAWRQLDGPPMAIPPGAGDRLEVTPSTAGRYVLEVTAMEAGKAVASATRVLEVFPPTPALQRPPLPNAPAPVSSPLGGMDAPIDLPAPARTAQPPKAAAAPRIIESGPSRPAAQIHPSTGGGLYNFDGGGDPLADPVLPIPGPPTL